MSGLVRAESLFRARRLAERRRRTVRPMLALAVATTIAGAVVWTGWSSPVLRLTSITVKGTSRLTIAQVLSAARISTGRSLLDVPVEAIRGRVARLAPVAQVRVTRQWPHRLLIDVVERTPVAAVAGVGGSVLLDRSGVAFDTVSAPPSGVLTLQVAAPAAGRSSAAARAALAVWTQLPPAVRREVRSMSAPSADAVSFTLSRGATVVWGSPDHAADKLAVLASLLRQRATTYDVSTPSVAVTR